MKTDKEIKDAVKLLTAKAPIGLFELIDLLAIIVELLLDIREVKPNG